jgi:hypothetical protein
MLGAFESWALAATKPHEEKKHNATMYFICIPKVQFGIVG